jgi:hypothetical protein
MTITISSNGTSIGIDKGLLVNHEKSSLGNQQLIQNELENKFGKSVQVSISEEGQEKYRQSIQNQDMEAMSYDEMIQQREKLLEQNSPTDLDYDFQLGNEVAKYKEDGIYQTTQEKADTLLKSYAILYDQIVKGYSNGTRAIHVQDDTVDKGYRVLTQEEEISALTNSYKKYADDLQNQIEQEPKIKEAMEKYMKKLETIGGRMPAMASEYYTNVYQKENKDIIPDHLSEKLVNASNLFVKKYSSSAMNLMDIQELLKNIKVF